MQHSQQSLESLAKNRSAWKWHNASPKPHKCGQCTMIKLKLTEYIKLCYTSTLTCVEHQLAAYNNRQVVHDNIFSSFLAHTGCVQSLWSENRKSGEKNLVIFFRTARYLSLEWSYEDCLMTCL